MLEAIASLLNIIFIIFPTTTDKFDDSDLKYPRLLVISILLFIIILSNSALCNFTYYQ
jgi:hypothetical protein